MTNIGEFHNGTNPRDADTDNDGVKDGQDDANHDGIEDERRAVRRRSTSFDATTGKLTVTLVNGDELTGTVNDDTEIECDDDDPPDDRHDAPRRRDDRAATSGRRQLGAGLDELR